jgi:hypothetical protein
LLYFAFKISNNNITPFLKLKSKGLLRIYNKVFVSGKDIAIKDNFYKSGSFVLFKVSYFIINICNISFIV